MTDTNKSNDISNFIKLADELLSEESRQIIYNILWKELKVHVDVGLTGAPGPIGIADKYEY